jgi:hypothetical protein
MNSIRKSIVLAITGAALALGATAAFALEDIVESARVGCKTEVDTLCKDVTPGEGRVLQCLSAHQDKLSSRCVYALADGSLQLDRLALAIKYVFVECKADADKHCADIKMGDGRIAECLKKNQASLDPKCTQAMKDTNMQVK